MASPARGGQLVNPKSFIGIGRVPQQLTGNLDHDLMIDKEFHTLCPPDVQPNTRVLGLCGAHDFRGNAGPIDDGWFFSDFYLFHHLLQSTHGFQSPKQTWMTCVDPIEMVKRHSTPDCPAEWYHGSPGASRKVVMDAEIAEKVMAQGNIMVTKPEDLRDRFLAILEEEIIIAAQMKQPLLVLIFGHGNKSTHGIFVGRHRGQSEEITNIPRLNIQTVHSIMRKDVDLTLVVTSCHSGGWIVQPKFANSSSIFNQTTSLPLNITAMTAAGPSNTSLSMSRSASMRASGSKFVGAIVSALLTISEVREESTENESHSFLQARDEDGELITDSPTYNALAHTVMEEYNQYQKPNDHQVRFAAKDDEWEQEWRRRSGFPLLAYRGRFEALRTAPESNEGLAYDPNPDVARGVNYLTGGYDIQFENAWENQSTQPSFNGRTLRAKVRIVQAKAAFYLASKPGSHDISGNGRCHTAAIRLLRRDRMCMEEILALESVLDYRLAQMNIATGYAEYLGIKLIDCVDFDTESWCHEQGLKRSSNDQNISNQAIVNLKKYDFIRSEIMSKQLFDSPRGSEGFDYDKPEEYLAIAFVVAGLEKDDVLQGINALARFKRAEANSIANSDLGRKVRSSQRVRDSANGVLRLWGRASSRFRSLSPNKWGDSRKR